MPQATPTERRQRFRAILSGRRCIHPADVFDPISARIAEDIGFDAGMFAGSVASMTVLGAPDIVVLTLSEFAEQARLCNLVRSKPNRAIRHGDQRVISLPSFGIATGGPSTGRSRSRHPHSTAWLLLTTGLPSDRSMSSIASIWVVLVQLRK